MDIKVGQIWRSNKTGREGVIGAVDNRCAKIIFSNEMLDWDVHYKSEISKLYTFICIKDNMKIIKPKSPSPIKNKDLPLPSIVIKRKTKNKETDMVNKPPHYKDASGIECKEITCHREMPFSLGNAIKYLYRAGSKGDLLEDLKKAEWYLRVAYLNDERVPKAVEVRLLEVAAHRKTAAGRALNLIRLHEIAAAYQAVKSEVEKLEAGE